MSIIRTAAPSACASAGKVPSGSHPSPTSRSGSPALRIALAIYAMLVYRYALGFIFQEWWAIDTWPFPYTDTMSYMFIASILAAGATSILYCAGKNDLRAMFGVGIDLAVIAGPIAVLALMSGQASKVPLAIGTGVAAAAGLLAAAWLRRYEFRDRQPTPVPVRLSFVAFILALWVFGGALAAGSQRILPWAVPPEIARIYGWAFLGASTYFVYGLLVPVWSNAAGQLLSFLAYDLVLIVPFIDHFGQVTPDRMINHIVYTSAVVISAVVAVYYCFIHPRTRLFRRPLPAAARA